MKQPFFLFFLFLFVACSSSQKVPVESDKLHQLLQVTFDRDAELVYNATNEYVLAYLTQEPTALKPYNGLDFCIVDISSNTIVYRAHKFNARVKWISDYVVEVHSQPEVHSSNDEKNEKMNQYQIDVRTLMK